jgi:dTDP-L-rhamnose 4-epimerase
MRILLTGGAGFIGSHTARALVDDGHTVRLLDRLDPQIHGPSPVFPAHLPASAECLHGDILRPADLDRALEGVDAVAHLAAFTGVGQSMYALQSYAETNVSGTAALVEAILRRGRPYPKILLASSRAVYGEGTAHCAVHGPTVAALRPREQLDRGDFDLHCPRDGRVLEPRPTAEDRPLSPVSFYGWTKRAQEEILRHAAACHGMNVTILRYFNVYGAHQSLVNPYTGVINVFYNRLRGGRPIALYEGGRPLRDFVHVADVARANAAALAADVPTGTTLNIGAGEAHTIRRVADTLAEVMGATPRYEDRGEFRVGDIFSGVADVAAARRALSWAPRVTLAQGLADFVAWADGQPSADGYERTVEELKNRGLFGAAKEQEVRR